MPGPWDDYKPQPASSQDGPWSEYAKPPAFGPSETPAHAIGKGDLPSDLPQKALRFGVKALPYVGAAVGTLVAPEGTLPAIGGALLGGALGSMGKQGVEYGTGAPEAPKSWNEAAGNVAYDSMVQGANEVGGRLIGGALGLVAKKFAPQKLYQSALKPPPVMLTPAERTAVVNTGLREGIPVSNGGFNKTIKLTDALNTEIADRIGERSSELGPVISPSSVAQRVEQRRPLFQNQVNPDADMGALTGSKREFLQKHTTEAPYTKIAPSDEGAGFYPVGQGTTSIENPMTLAEAQAEKQGTYRQLRKKYGELSSADVEAQKALARGLKEEIVERYPELAGLNQRDSSLIALEEQLARFTGREGNKNVLGLIPAVVGTGAGMMAGHGPEGAAAGGLGTLAILALDNPEIKSRLAIALSRAQGSAVGKGLGAARNATKGVINIPNAMRAAEQYDPGAPPRP